MQSSIVSEAKAIENELIAHRRHLHQNPELGFDLPETTAYVMQQLREYGYAPKAVGKAGISAVIGPDGGKTFLIRGDMDALPMKEETGLPFSSINGKMHACGHDFHTSALLGAAKLLKAHESELKGQVKLMFQPAEEIMDGANDMIAAGILENHMWMRLWQSMCCMTALARPAIQEEQAAVPVMSLQLRSKVSADTVQHLTEM